MTAATRATDVPDAGGEALSDGDFARLRELFYRRTGISFADNKRYFVDKRVSACVAAAGAPDFAAWFSRLRLGGEPALMQSLINALTVNETYFLREDYQFDCLVRSVLPAVLEARRRAGTEGEPVRILSLPSSTGEEPYSIAIRLLEEWDALDTVDVEIAAGDIDTRVLEAAREGAYGARSLQRVPAPVLSRYFTRLPDGRRRVVQDLRDAVDFRTVNVCDVESMRAYRRYDVVFCRNLLIYFDELSMRQAAENLFGALRPGGYLFLGHSESMSRISSIFTPTRMPEGIVYQRPAGAPR